MYHKDVVIVVNRHDDCGVPPSVPQTCVDTEFLSPCRGHTQQAGRVRSMESIRLASTQGGRSYAILPRHASQFDPTIDKERKLIGNLGRNMPVLPDSPECVALRADMRGDQLNS